MSGPHQVALLVDEYLFTWQVDALERMLAETDVEITLVVINNPDESCDEDVGAAAVNNPRSLGLNDVKLFIKVLREQGAWAFVLAERKLGWVLGGVRQVGMQKRHVNEIDCLRQAEFLRCEPEGKDDWNRFPEEVVNRVRDEADIAIRFGFGLIEGDILDAPEYGVLSFHPADIRKYRGVGPSQAFRDGAEEAGATLQQLSETIDGGRIVDVRTVDITDAYTLDEVRRRVNELQRSMLAVGIRKLGDSNFEPWEPETLGEYNSLTTRRSLSYSLPILVKNVFGRIRDRLT